MDTFEVIVAAVSIVLSTAALIAGYLQVLVNEARSHRERVNEKFSEVLQEVA